jgi:hypothetical protein
LVNNGLVNHCSGGLYLNIGKAVEFKDSLPCPEIQFLMTAQDTEKAVTVLNYEIQNAVDFFKMPVGNSSWDALTAETELKTSPDESELVINKLYFAGINPYLKAINNNLLYIISHKDKSGMNNYSVTSPAESKTLDINIKWNIEKTEAENWHNLIIEKAVDYYWTPKEFHQDINKYTPLIVDFAESIPEGDIKIILAEQNGNYYFKFESSLNLNPEK